MPRTPATSVGLTRPVGTAPGGMALVGSCAAAYIVARLTGAVAVAVVLAALAVGGLGALIAGWWRLRRMPTIAVVAPHRTTVGENATITVDLGRDGRTAHVTITDRGTLIATGWATGGTFTTDCSFDVRGIIDSVDVAVRSAGTPGLVWWQRLHRAPIDELVIAPRSTGRGARLDVVGDSGGAMVDDGTSGFGDDELDGIRPWRDGDSERSVHWASSLRTGTLVVHDAHSMAPLRCVVRSNPAAVEADVEAGRCRWALDEARRRGAQTWAAIGDGEPVEIGDAEAAARWSAECVPPVPVRPPVRPNRRPAEPDSTLTPTARWSTAAATCVSTSMLAEALGTSLIIIALLIAGSIAAAAVTSHLLRHGRVIPQEWHTLMAVISFSALAVIVMMAGGGNTNLLSMLRGPLPQLMMLLVVVYGFECIDRRTARANLSISVVTACYATGLRVDGRLGTWLAIWFVCSIAALAAVARPRTDRTLRRSSAHRPPHPWRRAGSIAAVSAVGVAVTVLVLMVVAIPSGPAALTLPAFIEDARSVAAPGGLVAADGTPSSRGDVGDGTRGASSNGGYPGFSEQLDTSIRGPLSDDVVMRVRAPEPDFWRGQTFGQYDGRFWYADDQQGRPAQGPSIAVPPATGDREEVVSGVRSKQFIQTYFVEVDQPNIVFAAYRPTQIIFDGTVWRRPDGSLRSDVVLTKGSVYTVVSERAETTEASLRDQPGLSDAVAAHPEVAQYLTLPSSVTDRTRALADQLSVPGASTYDTVLAMEAWLAAHVQYDLGAPVPDEGVDAVDDFLFESQRGFCEQIASALAVMLRSQGMPARLVTGYVPGQRDRISGVWKVRGTDAHAWVEVWFPLSGWQAFDPTATVPLAGETQPRTVGADLARAIADAVGDHAVTLLTVLVCVLVVIGVARLVRRTRARHRRGRWGLLQDRWHRAAEQRGLDTTCSNPELARRWATVEPPIADDALRLAGALDRVLFDPTFVDRDELYDEAITMGERLGV